jgi:PAS domain S-box-containing protein
MLGYASFEELAVRNLEKGGFEPSYPRKQFREILERDGKVEVFEAAWMRADGQVMFVRENAQAVRGEDGTVYYEGTIEDITARKKMLDALKQSERDYRGLFEYAHDAIIIFDPEGEIVREVNGRACELYGFSREEFIGRSLEAISHDVTRGKSEIVKTLKKGDTLNFETLQYRKDGSEIYLEVNAAVLDYKGRPAILSINRDVTARKRMEQALRESEHKYRTLIEQASDAIFITNQQGSYVEANSMGCELLGYEREEMQRLSAKDIFLPEGAAAPTFVSDELRAGRTVLEERRLRHKDGTAVPVEVSSKILQDGRLLSIARLTERHAAREM